MDLKTATVEAIKAFSFDILSEIERLNVNLRACQQELVNRQAKEKLDTVAKDATPSV